MSDDLKAQILQMIEEHLREDSDISNTVLREKAEEIDPSIKELGARAFNARYPLQVKRKLAPPKPRKPRKPKAPKAPPVAEASEVVAAPAPPPRAPRPARDDVDLHIRETLLDLARDLSNADRVTLINVISGIDDYVARIKEAIR